VLRIGGGKAGSGVTFEKMAEGLDGRSDVCPNLAK
jgi:hypothetical protein